MSQAFNHIRKHWLTLLLLVGSLVAVNWIVTHKRAPGAVTVIEAQGMDMTAMRAPVGTQPVSVDLAQQGTLGGGTTLPATVEAFSDEDVVARVPGRVSKVLVYPGDKVSAGQVLALLDAPEYAAEREKMSAMSGAKEAEVLSADREIAHHRNILSKAQATVREATLARDRARTDADAAALELRRAREEVATKESAIREQEALLSYAEKNAARKMALYKQGAVSQDESQSAERDRDAAQARVRGAQSERASAEQAVLIAEKRCTSAKQMVSEADAAIEGAKAEQGQAEEGIAQAHADASARKFEAQAAKAEVASASAFADYRELRALGPGIVSERVVSPGTPVMAGQVVLRLTTVNRVRVQADVPESLANSVQDGSLVEISSGAKRGKAKITSVFPRVDPTARTFRVESIVNNEDGHLKAGMFVRMTIGGGESALSVRSKAVQLDDSGSFVWVVRQKTGTGESDWTCTMHPEISMPGPGKCPKCGMDLTQRQKGGSLFAHRQPVETGRQGASRTEIKSGLHEGDQVIWKGLDDLIEGTPVRVEETSKPEAEPASISDMSAMPEMAAHEKKRVPASSHKTTPKVDYTCPMHPEVHSDKPGKCPKCGMDLVKDEKSS